MAKSQFAYGVSLAAIAVTMWGAPAQAQNVAAAPANAGFQRGGGGHHHHNGGGGGVAVLNPGRLIPASEAGRPVLVNRFQASVRTR